MLNHPILAEQLNLIEQKLDSYFNFPYNRDFFIHQSGHELDYDLDHLQKALEPVKHLIKLGGKRWRALGLLLTGQALGLETSSELLDFATLVELTHTGSLIIDDIEDESPLRRGQKSSHIVYGVDISINAGNYAYFLATKIIDDAQISVEKKYSVFSSWAKALRCLHIGQGLDISWHRDHHFWPTILQYEAMCEMKTGGLSYLIGKLPGILASRDPLEIEDLGKAWRRVGLGFQILDDVKNLQGGMKGKMLADDLLEGKKSLPLILAVAKNPDLKKIIEHFFLEVKELTADGQQDMIQSILTKIFELDVLEESKHKARNILEQAQEKISSLVGLPNYGFIEIFLNSLLEEMT